MNDFFWEAWERLNDLGMTLSDRPRMTGLHQKPWTMFDLRAIAYKSDLNSLSLDQKKHSLAISPTTARGKFSALFDTARGGKFFYENESFFCLIIQHTHVFKNTVQPMCLLNKGPWPLAQLTPPPFSKAFFINNSETRHEPSCSWV